MKHWGRMLMAVLAFQQASPIALGQQTAQVIAQTQPPAQAYSQGELEQMLAPIALYPDDLLTQILVAATYPLEVVMASRWAQQPTNKALKGDALVRALDAQDWDGSVKSLVPFSGVLKMMSDQLDWTQKLGDAFLAQQSDVFAAVQALRGRAQAQGALQSNAQQTVTKEAAAIVIQPKQPATVYVPMYNPTVVYGPWPYPSYPPTYYPPSPGYAVGTALATGLAFGAGIAITSALWGWGRPNWGNGSVNVNVNRFNSINSNRSSINSDVWRHSTDHRRGVAYSNNQVRQQFRPNRAGDPATRDAFRGRAPNGAPGLRHTGESPAGTGLAARLPNAPGSAANQGNVKAGLANRAGVGGSGGDGKLRNAARPNQGGQGPARAHAPHRPNGSAGANLSRPQFAQRSTGGNQAFKGVGNGAATRAQAAQGRASRAGMARSAGGGGKVIHTGGRR